MKRKYYLAYGSNLNIEQMKRRCPTAKAVGVAEIEDYELLFKGSRTGSYLTIEKKKGSKVPVAVWLVDDECEKALDRYEGYPRFYYKKEMLVDIVGIQSGKIIRRKAFVYIMDEKNPIGVPSSFYTETCIRGYRAFGFDEKYLIKALKESKRRTEYENKYDEYSCN